MEYKILCLDIYKKEIRLFLFRFNRLASNDVNCQLLSNLEDYLNHLKVLSIINKAQKSQLERHQ